MQRLTVSHHHIVRDVYDIIDRTQTYCGKFILQPFRTLLNLTPLDRNSSIPWTSFCRFYSDFDRQVVIVYLEFIHTWAMQLSSFAIAHEISIEITCYSPMRTSISSVGSNVNFNEVITFKTKIFCSRCTNYGIFGEHHNTIMSSANSNFVFGTNHA